MAGVQQGTDKYGNQAPPGAEKKGGQPVNTYGGLASTGFAMTIGGLTMGPIGLVLMAAVLVAVGALALRLGWRRGQPVNGR